jgi:hypothetical protein
MAEAPDTLSFRVSAETLNGALEILKALDGPAQHPEAYQALVLERSRRKLQSPPQKIRLAREACEALPHVGRHLLRRGSVMHDDLQA